MILRFIPLLGFALVVLAGNYFIFEAIGWEFRMVVILIYAYMFVFSSFFEHVLMRNLAANKFVINYMGFSGGKLILSLFLLLGYVYFNRDYIRPFAVSFLLVYFSFTTFEIVRLLRYFKKS